MKRYYFEDVVRHESEVYGDASHYEDGCPMCEYARKVMDKYDFLGFWKSWDYDD